MRQYIVSFKLVLTEIEDLDVTQSVFSPFLTTADEYIYNIAVYISHCPELFFSSVVGEDITQHACQSVKPTVHLW